MGVTAGVPILIKVTPREAGITKRLRISPDATTGTILSDRARRCHPPYLVLPTALRVRRPQSRATIRHRVL